MKKKCRNGNGLASHVNSNVFTNILGSKMKKKIVKIKNLLSSYHWRNKLSLSFPRCAESSFSSWVRSQ